MAFFDRCLILYLKPLWRAYYVSLYINDKIFRTHYIETGADPGAALYTTPHIWALLSAGFTFVYVLGPPTIVTEFLSSHDQFPVLIAGILLFLFFILCGFIRHKTIAPSFTVPKFKRKP